MPESTLTLRFTESPGALDRIIGLLRRRGFPIDGITLARTHEEGVGRMTVVVAEPAAAEQVTRHLHRLPDVVEVTEGGNGAVQREFALVRVRCTPQERPVIEEMLAGYNARTLSTGEDHLVLEVSGCRSDLDDIFSKLAPYGIEDSTRTNPMVLAKSGTTDRQTA